MKKYFIFELYIFAVNGWLLKVGTLAWTGGYVGLLAQNFDDTKRFVIKSCDEQCIVEGPKLSDLAIENRGVNK